jgi:hypothetical protein
LISTLSTTFLAGTYLLVSVSAAAPVSAADDDDDDDDADADADADAAEDDATVDDAEDDAVAASATGNAFLLYSQGKIIEANSFLLAMILEQSQSHCLSLATDTIANMNTFGKKLEEMGVCHVYCTVHVLQLTCKQELYEKKSQRMEEALGAAYYATCFCDQSQSHCLSLTTDTTANMNTFGKKLEEMGVCHVYCTVHVLQLTCKQELYEKKSQMEEALGAAYYATCFCDQSQSHCLSFQSVYSGSWEAQECTIWIETWLLSFGFGD